mmetsp:Transcript_15172/g.34197  ORF Transcript_15172/g.34197 Transcript_15172/m.34197 type:complete len:239 (+) Transcript_15172:3371-4087(+)
MKALQVWNHGRVVAGHVYQETAVRHQLLVRQKGISFVQTSQPLLYDVFELRPLLFRSEHADAVLRMDVNDRPGPCSGRLTCFSNFAGGVRHAHITLPRRKNMTRLPSELLCGADYPLVIDESEEVTRWTPVVSHLANPTRAWVIRLHPRQIQTYYFPLKRVELCAVEWAHSGLMAIALHYLLDNQGHLDRVVGRRLETHEVAIPVIPTFGLVVDLLAVVEDGQVDAREWPSRAVQVEV